MFYFTAEITTVICHHSKGWKQTPGHVQKLRGLWDGPKQWRLNRWWVCSKETYSILGRGYVWKSLFSLSTCCSDVVYPVLWVMFHEEAEALCSLNHFCKQWLSGHISATICRYNRPVELWISVVWGLMRPLSFFSLSKVKNTWLLYQLFTLVHPVGYPQQERSGTVCNTRKHYRQHFQLHYFCGRSC